MGHKFCKWSRPVQEQVWVLQEGTGTWSGGWLPWRGWPWCCWYTCYLQCVSQIPGARFFSGKVVPQFPGVSEIVGPEAGRTLLGLRLLLQLLFDQPGLENKNYVWKMKLYYPNLCSVNLAVQSPPTVSGASVNVMQAPQRGIWKVFNQKHAWCYLSKVREMSGLLARFYTRPLCCRYAHLWSQYHLKCWKSVIALSKLDLSFLVFRPCQSTLDCASRDINLVGGWGSF